MIQSTLDDVPATDTAAGKHCSTRQPWESPTLDVLPLRETYNNPNFGSDAGMLGS